MASTWGSREYSGAASKKEEEEARLCWSPFFGDVHFETGMSTTASEPLILSPH